MGIEVIPAIDGDQLPFVETLPAGFVGTTSAWAALNTSVFFRFRLAAPIQVNTARVYIGTASGNIDIGVGTINPSTLAFVRLASTGATPAAGTNAIQSIALSGGAIWLPAGVDLVIGMGSNNTSVTVARGVPAAAVTANGQMYSRASATIAATDTLSNNSVAFAPWIWLGFV